MDKKNVPLRDFIQNRVSLLTLAMRPNSISGIKSPADTFLEFCEAKAIKDVNEVDEKIAVLFFQHLINDVKLHSTTLVRYRIYLKKIFKGLIINPFGEIPPFKKASTPFTPYNKEQRAKMDAWLKANDAQAYLFTRFMRLCLIRPVELSNVKIKDIDFQDGTIRIPAQNGKNSKFHTIVVPSNLLNDIKDWQFSPKDYYIFSKKGVPSTEKVGKNYFYRRHKKGLNELEFSNNHQMYGWKATGALGMLKAGADLKQVQKQGRWKSLDQMDAYLSSFGTDDMKNIRNFDL